MLRSKDAITARSQAYPRAWVHNRKTLPCAYPLVVTGLALGLSSLDLAALLEPAIIGTEVSDRGRISKLTKLQYNILSNFWEYK